METDDGDKLYLIRESKFIDDLNDLRPNEMQKIICGHLTSALGHPKTRFNGDCG